MSWVSLVGDAFAAQVREIATTLDERPEHGLVLVFGQTWAWRLRAMAGVLGHLDHTHDLTWHHLPLHGIEALSVLRPGRMVWVTGLEDLEPDARLEALVSLNRARDLVQSVGVRLVLWLPASALSQVYEHCADLLSWRDALIQLARPGGGEAAPSAPPPWAIARSLAAGWATAVVGPWLLHEDLDLARRLFTLLPWLGVVDDEATGRTVRSLYPKHTVHDLPATTDLHYLQPLRKPELHALKQPGSWWGPPRQRGSWWSRGEFLTWGIPPVFAVGAGPPPHQDEPDERWIWPLAPDSAEWLGDPLEGEAGARLAEALALLLLSCSRPEPPHWWVRKPLPAPSTGSLWPLTLVVGPDWRHGPEGWREPDDAWSQARDPDERNRERDDDQRPFDGRIDEIADQVGAYGDLLPRWVYAHGLDTNDPDPHMADLLSRVGRVLVATGHDRAVEATLAALSRPFRVICADGDLEHLSDDELAVVRPWGEPSRPDTMRRGIEGLQAWRGQHRKAAAWLAERLDREVAIIGALPDEPRVLALLFDRSHPLGGSRKAWLYPVAWASRGAVERAQALGLQVRKRGGWGSDWWPNKDARSIVRDLDELLREPPATGPSEPPLPIPLHDWSVARELLNPGRFRELADGPWDMQGRFSKLGRERWVATEWWDASGSATLWAWAVHAELSRQPGTWRWRIDVPRHVRRVEVFGSQSSGGLAELTSWAESPMSRHSLTIVDLTDLPFSSWAQAPSDLVHALEALCLKGEASLLLLDRERPGFPLERHVTSLRFQPRSSVPEAWLEHLAHTSPPLSGIAPWLTRRSMQDDSVAHWLRRPESLLTLAAEVQDPLDPGSKTFELFLHTRASAGTLGQPPAPIDDIAKLRADTSGTLDPELHRRRALAEHDPTEILRWLYAQAEIPAAAHRLGGTGAADWPASSVRLSAFRIDAFPVTWARFEVFIAAGGYRRPDLWNPDGWTWRERNAIEGPESFSRTPHPGEPVTGVSWYEAEAFLRWLGSELPSEAQWEATARRGHGLAPSQALRPVGLGAPEPANASVPAYELGGGVLEWCADWYDALYPGVAAGLDPRGPRSGLERSCRGPAWWAKEGRDNLLAHRWHFAPETRRPDLGFRGCTR